MLNHLKKKVNNRYKKSEAFLERALKTIPLGSQTFSKSITQFPLGVSPYFAERAEGAYLWDVDGNQYTDFANALGSITLGYCDKDIMNAVKDQLEKGTIFSLASVLEIEVSEMLCEAIPCAEMVRFGKNGSDATAAAIRLSRAYTGKDHILVCGYHGWQDWYIGSTSRNLGVPQSTQDLTHSFPYNDISALRTLLNDFQNKVACVILEPCNIELPKDGYLSDVKKLCEENDALLVFDETVTGFRYAIGGAQSVFSVIPDMATFGKGLANGYPLSAVVGRKEIMKLMEDIFFSFTFGGETLSLAAAKAVITKLNKEDVIQSISTRGEFLIKQLKLLISQHALQDQFEVSGFPTWSFFLIKDGKNWSSFEAKTYFLQTMFENGIICLGSHNLSYAHSLEDIEYLISVYDKYLQKMSQITCKEDLLNQIQGDILMPLFKVR